MRRTGFRTHFLQNSKNFKISNKIYTESFILMKFDDKFLHCWNWFINTRIMTLFQFWPVVDLLCFCSVLCFAMFCALLFICALWSPAGKGLTSWLSFVVSSVSLSLSHWYPGSGVVLDCIDSWSLHHYLLLLRKPVQRTDFRTNFFTKFKIFLNKQQNLHKKLPIDEMWW